MRRPALIAIAVATLALAACGSGKVVSPTPQTVVGALPKAAGPTKGDPAAGRKLFVSSGCGGCHVFAPAGSKGNVGPNLDNLAADAQKANHGSLEQYAFESIKNPSSYIAPGFQNVMPNFGQTLKDQQISDLVAFLTKKS